MGDKTGANQIVKVLVRGVCGGEIPPEGLDQGKKDDGTNNKQLITWNEYW